MTTKPRRDAKSASPNRLKVSSAESRKKLPHREEDLGSRESLVVVAVGASAGGLEAFRGLIDALPASSGMAFILVQHLEPSHASMMADLLSSHTPMNVREAEEGMQIEADNIFVIPPGVYLSVADSRLVLSEPNARHGARLPFDFLLNSLAEGYAQRLVCLVLSGTGTDGSIGLSKVKEHSGLVLVQEPSEAQYDGMPRRAMETGLVDAVMPVADMPAALLEYKNRLVSFDEVSPESPQNGVDWLKSVVSVLKERTSQDFSLYKPGTLQRRIARRMILAGVSEGATAEYLSLLRKDDAEPELLAKDLLINVTKFFRDPAVFADLAETVIPGMLADRDPEKPMRVWVVGCSTGEEAYSLAILFREAILASKRSCQLQIFASDADPEAVAFAREGLYPQAIEADVSASRRALFFSREGSAYRVASELRSCVVFTTQDVLLDAPFSRLDMVSCRNLLIYLGPEAQTKVIGQFHFALNQGGILLLGSAETPGDIDGSFDVLSKQNRVYRRIGPRRLADVSFMATAGDPSRWPKRLGALQPLSTQSAIEDACKRLVMRSHAPASVVINKKNECLCSLGPTDRYLKVAAGHPTHDLLSMAPPPLRMKLRSAINLAPEQGSQVFLRGGRYDFDGQTIHFRIAAQRFSLEGEDLIFISFVDDSPSDSGATRTSQRSGNALPGEDARVAALEQELEATRTELQSALHNLDIANEEHRAINEEALSVNEEFQATNEELLTSKEELQSLNEELTALNIQLQEMLERQRVSANDLQNVLYSTDVAILFLDRDLSIRFFTPASTALFRVIPTDIGRPLSDLNSLSADSALLMDADRVMQDSIAIEREVETRSGVWFIRRILPYRVADGGVGGVVITYTDISERKLIAKALEAAKRQAELANKAKSRFLAVASHDLRQPLQTLFLLHGLLANMSVDERMRKILTRIDVTLTVITDMLNTLLDINQIEAGTVPLEKVDFNIGDLLERMRTDFGLQGDLHNLKFRVVPCNVTVHSDPLLLEQILRNLLSNAFKYTDHGKVLLGCRRRPGGVSLEVWDTGIGIPEEERSTIFDEYHQIGNPARERGHGLGLGLYIVRRLGHLLGHEVTVRSREGDGSGFSVLVAVPSLDTQSAYEQQQTKDEGAAPLKLAASGSILVVDDDSDLCELLQMFLVGEGYTVMTASDGAAAIALVMAGDFQPDMILADFNLPKGLDGVQTCRSILEGLDRRIPVAILTGDISSGPMRSIAEENFIQLNKPIKLQDLTRVLESSLPELLSQAQPVVVPSVKLLDASAIKSRAESITYVVDDDQSVGDALCSVLEHAGKSSVYFADAEAFLATYRPSGKECLLVDAYLPGISGLELLRQIRSAGHCVPAIMITGQGDVPMAVEAMKAGAGDFLEKPVSQSALLASVERALEQSRSFNKLADVQRAAAARLATMTPRERQVMDMVLAGNPSKNIAADLGISQRTVENHRASVMRKSGCKSIPALARFVLAAVANGADNPEPDVSAEGIK